MSCVTTYLVLTGESQPDNSQLESPDMSNFQTYKYLDLKPLHKYCTSVNVVIYFPTLVLRHFGAVILLGETGKLTGNSDVLDTSAVFTPPSILAK